MPRIHAKLSMCTLLMALVVCVGAVPLAYGDVQAGTPIGPGVGGQVHAFAFDPADTNVAYAGGDVCGVYKYSFLSDRWEPWSAGLGHAELSKAYYVDDLIVVRQVPGGPVIPPSRQGVYAATWGGIYFRRDDSTSWVCLTPSLLYTGGYAATAFHYEARNTSLRIPFSSLAFDAKHGTIYAGAGRGRIDFVGGVYQREDNYTQFYPTAANPQSIPLSQQYSVWKCNLATGQSFNFIANSANKGQVRQLAVARYAVGETDTTEIVCAADSGIFTFRGELNIEISHLWPAEVATKTRLAELGKSDDPWGVAAGSDGRLYALMSRTDRNPALDPGVMTFELAATNRDTVTWREFGAGPTDLLWPYNQTWSNYVHSSGDDLTELSVVVVPGHTDQVFVGTSHSNGARGDCGYFRYGEYNNGANTGWAHIHRTQGAATGIPGEVWVTDWRHGAIRDWQLTSDQLGWHQYYPSLRALVPFSVHPAAPNRMVGVDYHNPLVTSDGGLHWQNLYCSGNSSTGWQNKGLNLLCARSATFMSDGRFVIGAADYGVFCSTDPPINRWYKPLHSSSTSNSPPFPDARDVEVVHFNGHDEVYMVDEQVDGTNPDERIWVWRDVQGTDHWTPISDGIAAVADTVRIQDIVFPDASTAFAAVGIVANGRGGSHYYIYKGTRSGDLNWQWQKCCDVDSARTATQETRWVNRICLIPGTTRLLIAAKAKTGSGGGVFCVDYAAADPATGLWSSPVPWLSESDGADRGFLARNVTALAVDWAGQYAYAGSSRGDGFEHGRGGVVRFSLGSNAMVVGCDILSGGPSYHFPIEPANFPAEFAGGMQAWEYSTNVADIEIDPFNPKVIYCAVNNQSCMDAAVGVYMFKGNTWIQKWGGGEAGSGAMTVDVDDSDPDRMYIGSVTQEFFEADFTPAAHPEIAAWSAYPIMAVTADSAVFAVHIASADSIKTATVDLTGLNRQGVALALKDDGKGDDARKNDGVFTSPRFVATLTAGVTYAAGVFAQAYDGGYDKRTVSVAVVDVGVKFKSDTAIAGDLNTLLTAKPYSSAYFKAKPNDDESDDVMIVTFDDNASSPLILGRQWGASGGTPFVDRSEGAISSWFNASLPKGSRSVCCADYDNDGDTDLFICNPGRGGKLYHSNFAEGIGGFADSTSTVFGADASLLAGAVTASWGDYNGDGFVDLFVATTSYVDPIDDLPAEGLPSAPQSSQGDMNTSGDLRIFKNSGGTSLRKSFMWGGVGGSICLAGCWVDIDNDGDLDLVSTRFADVGVEVIENCGINQGHTDQIMVPATWSISSAYAGANSISILDYDHDTYPDLLLTEAGQYHQARILRNNFGNAQSRSFTSTDLASGTAWNGAIVADFNRDGQEDFVFLPKDADVNPALLVSNGYMTAPVIDVDPMLQSIIGGGTIAPVYRNLGFTLGLRDGRTGGGFAADLNNDHTCDLFLGRSSTDQFLYTNAATKESPGNWIEVRLKSGGDSNGSLIGTKVVVEGSSGRRWTKVVDGGSGRGGQSANTLLFGLGDEAGPDSVKVYYPSGEIDRIGTAVNTAVTATEDRMGAFYGRPAFNYELQPGTMDWVFKWKTNRIKGDLREDQVTITPHNDPTHPGCASVFASPLVLKAGLQPGVSTSVYWGGQYWVHELRWSGLECMTDCRWDYNVFSAAGPQGVSVTSQPVSVTTSVQYCLPVENYGQ